MSRAGSARGDGDGDGDWARNPEKLTKEEGEKGTKKKRGRGSRLLLRGNTQYLLCTGRLAGCRRGGWRTRKEGRQRRNQTGRSDGEGVATDVAGSAPIAFPTGY